MVRRRSSVQGRPWIRKVVGAYRLWWGWCPACNSSAPAIYDCHVCRVGLKFRREDTISDDGYFVPWPPSPERKALWWRRFVEPPANKEG